MLHNGEKSEAALFVPTDVKMSPERKPLSHRMTQIN